MDWSRIRRKRTEATKPPGVYTSLDELIRIQFDARDFSLKPTQPVSSILSGRYASRLRGRGLNFEELRRYLPGDDVRSMDWKVTARTRTPHVRVYTEEKDRSVFLVIDQRTNMFFGTRNRMKAVTAAQSAALAAWRALDAGDRVGAVVFNDQGAEVFPARRSRQHLMLIFKTIVRMNHQLRVGPDVKRSPAQLNVALDKLVPLVPHDALVIMISDFDGVNEHTSRTITHLAGRNDVLGVLIHDPVRMDPGSLPLMVSDGAQQAHIDFSASHTRQAVIDDYRQEQDGLTMLLRHLSAPLLPISNEGRVIDQVRELLKVGNRG